MINTEICLSDRWNFLERKITLTLPANTGEIVNTIPGKIEALFIDGQKYEYFQDFEKFFINTQPSGTYSLYDDKILLPIFNHAKEVKILYYTSNCAKTFEGTEKSSLENADDISLIPEVFAEPLLVYGGCMRLKGNPQHIRFSYWLKMYNDALANLRSKISASMDETPNVRMNRY